MASGDLNGDEYVDLVFTAPHQTYGNTVYVFYGPHDLAGDSFLPDDADATLAWPHGTEFGWSLAIGDVVGDGTDDLIVGSPSEYDGNGAVHVFAGPLASASYGEGDTTASVRALDPGYLGWSVAAGDFDGDGKDELAAGACQAGEGGNGEAYLFDLDLEEQTKTSDATSRFYGVGLTGCSLANAGDFDGDGSEELMLGSYGSLEVTGFSWGGAVTMFFGRKDFAAEYHLNADPATNDAAEFRGGAVGENLGFAIAPAGDVNDDGFADIIIGAPAFRCDGCTGTMDITGAAYLVLGVGEDPFDPADSVLRGTSNAVSAVADVAWTTAAKRDWLGMAVDGAGYAGDDYGKWTVGQTGPVVLIGNAVAQGFAMAYDQSYRDGQMPDYDCAVQLDGTTACSLDRTGVPASRTVTRRVDNATSGGHRFIGPAGSRFGMTVLGAGDLDGDGWGDLVFGAPHQLRYEDAPGDGTAYAYPGK